MSNLRTNSDSRWIRARGYLGDRDQQLVIGLIVLLGTLILGATTPSFLTRENLLDIVRSTAVLGILGVGLAVVVIGRGLDLSAVAIMGITSAVSISLIADGHSQPTALVVGAGLALALGLVNGAIIAYAEVSPLYVTLATNLLFVGLARLVYLGASTYPVPDTASLLNSLGSSTPLGIPAVAIVFALSVGAISWLMSRNLGRFVYALGDNPDAARLSGLPTRPLTVLLYAISALMAFLAGLVSISIAGTAELRTIQSGTLLYDAIAVVVIGGVSLAGGRGTLGGVVLAALLIGILANAMVIHDFDSIEQALAKAAIVLVAIVLDSLFHPVDLEHSRSGDL